jgi:DNA-binding IclR family transcriptional regulator
MRNEDYSDREFLSMLVDAADGDMSVSTAELAAHIDLPGAHPLTNVGVRLGYLRRIGMVERDTENQRWYLTPLGDRFVRGHMTAAQRRALESLRDEGAAWAATESLASLLGGASQAQATMMRRQWQHGWAQRTR